MGDASTPCIPILGERNDTTQGDGLNVRCIYITRWDDQHTVIHEIFTTLPSSHHPIVAMEILERQQQTRKNNNGRIQRPSKVIILKVLLLMCGVLTHIKCRYSIYIYIHTQYRYVHGIVLHPQEVAPRIIDYWFHAHHLICTRKHQGVDQFRKGRTALTLTWAPNI